MIDKFIADVPASIWEEGRPARQRSWESSFNVAAWIRIANGRGKVRLFIVHTDEAGEQRALVDQVEISTDGSSLLSSQVRLRFTGKVSNVKVVLQLEDAAMRHQVEELYMQLRESHQHQRKLIASY